MKRLLLLPLLALLSFGAGFLIIGCASGGGDDESGVRTRASTGPALVVQQGLRLYALGLDEPRSVGLATLPSRWSAPAVSPDGSRVAYGSQGGISIMEIDGSQRKMVTRSGGGPAWSPDGRTLYFTRSEGSPGGWRHGEVRYSSSIFSVSAAGGTPRRVTDASVEGRCHLDPAVSPDGKRIAFSDWDACEGGVSRPRLRVVDPQGRQTADLRFLPGNGGGGNDPEISAPAWSPDGSRLAFCNNGNVWIANRDGSRPRRILAGVCMWHGDSPLWSRNGRWIAAAKPLSDGRTTFLIVHADGTGFRRLRTTSNSDVSLAGWVPVLPK